MDITTEDVPQIIRQIQETPLDIAFIALHGRLGEDGVIQGILENLDIPYTGSGVKASQMAFNKILTQKALKSAGLPVAEHYLITDGKNVDFKTAWGYLKSTPLVVKPACEGSSIGVHMVRHPSEWEPALKMPSVTGRRSLLNSLLKAVNSPPGFLTGRLCLWWKFVPKPIFLPLPLNIKKERLNTYARPKFLKFKQIKEMSLRAYEILGCEGFARVDLRVDEDEQPFILEVNTIPGFTETSLFPKAAHAAGYSFMQVCEKLLDLAYGKKIRR